jgi:exo-beta-1,3-glucanase (GH17 family)
MKIIHRFFILAIIIGLWPTMGASISHAGELKLNAPAVAYQPKGFTPDANAPDLTASQIRIDLRLLRNIGFRGIVTYGSKGVMGKIPEIARSEGFDGIIIMGIWDLFSIDEWQNALSQVPFVDGYCLGNEGLGVRYSADELLSQMVRLRKKTSLPVTTSEPIFKYFQPAYQNVLCKATDWIFPIIHPFWDQPFDPKRAVQWIIVHYDYLSATTGRNVIIKEAGFPSAGHVNLNEEAQILFFNEVARSGLRFFYFEAFDQPWKKDALKNSSIEAHWGLFKADGTPKKIVAFLTDRWTK